eukprot:946689-Pelagomonas_calceolata.AAC.1
MLTWRPLQSVSSQVRRGLGWPSWGSRRYQAYIIGEEKPVFGILLRVTACPWPLSFAVVRVAVSVGYHYHGNCARALH